MILYKAIKYKILEYCLNNIFESLYLNLIRKRGNIVEHIDELHVGMHLKSVATSGYLFEDCYITEITRKTEFKEVPIAIIKFTYAKINRPLTMSTGLAFRLNMRLDGNGFRTTYLKNPIYIFI